MPKNPKISIIVPIYNEVECIEPFIRRLKDQPFFTADYCEVIFVDNGSMDGSQAVIRRSVMCKWNIKGIFLSKNLGQTPAILAAIPYTQGDFIVIMDVDLQLFPEDMPKLISKAQEGFDVVFGYRTKRQDSFFRMFFSFLMNQVISWKVGIKVKDWGCSYICIRKGVAVSLIGRYGLNARFAKQLIAKEHKNHIAQVAVAHAPRCYGCSQYSFFALMGMAFDFIFNFSLKLERESGETIVPKELLLRGEADK